MNQKTIKVLIDEIYSEPPKKNYPTNKTDVHHTDDIWSLDILDHKDFGSENNRGYTYVLVVIAIFSTFGSTVALRNKNAQIKKNLLKVFLLVQKDPQL